MALCYDLRVFRDVYQLILKIFEDTQGPPREYKHTLGQDMKRDARDMGSAGKYANGGKYALTGQDSRLRGNDGLARE
jgi:hypothetical protein